MTTTEPTAWTTLREPAIAALAYGAFLAALAAGVGIEPLGWAVGVGCGALGLTLLTRAFRRSPLRELGWANRVTLTRAALAGGVAVLVADGHGGSAPTALLATLASVALALDWVDGRLARRTGTTSDLGARFDVEADAFLTLVLSVYVAGLLDAPWALGIGLMRYVFVAAAVVVPWLAAPLPPSRPRKVVGSVQGVLLVVVSAQLLPTGLAIALTGVSLVALTASFGRDVRWLWSHRAPLS
ncbi:CDP-alcohol phosphatidyltransferase family protein [Saccharomonospora sp. NB11]|uniref:CDP-alcohol phosphatidyltransferase family protein n=1 Tax=Saccharomonospora sp. NB11 TaxID=1642298 RepID=UPI0027DAF88A|nr:CDP-alcohol phosphatidyltransferase family protein [Saccharomonospora sp. NB11]